MILNNLVKRRISHRSTAMYEIYVKLIVTFKLFIFLHYH